MTRWDSLKYEKGEERERRNNGSRPSRTKRWTASNSNTANDGSRQPKYKSSLEGRQQQQQQSKDTNYLLSSSNTEPMLETEYEELLNALKSQLFRYQSGEGNKNDTSVVVIRKLMTILDSTSISQSSTAIEQSWNTDVFMALLNALEIADFNVRFFVSKTVESFLKLSVNGRKKQTLSKINLSKSQIQFGITTLLSRYNDLSVQPPEIQSSMHSSLLVSIALFVSNYVCELPPESTARRVVGVTFIPYLSSFKQNKDQEQGQEQGQRHQFGLTTASCSSSTFIFKCVCEATIALLQNPSHASAILAPLIEDVSIQLGYGIEEQTINPLRMELLWVLLKCLETPHDQGSNNIGRTEEQTCVCRTLFASIDAIQKLEKGNESSNATRNDADAQIIKPVQKFILKIVTEYNNTTRKPSEMATSFEYLMVASLQLLRVMVSCYPKAMSGTGWKLIIEGANRNVDSARSHTTGSYDMSSTVTSSYLPLILLIDNGSDIRMHRQGKYFRHLALTMECLADLVSILPWNKWLKQSGPGHDRQHGYTTARTLVMTPTRAVTSGLYKTVVDALGMLIGISKSAFCKCSDKSLMKPLGRLIKSVLLEIPFCDTKLIRAGEELWETITKAIVLDPQISGNITFNKEKQNLACEVLVASSGGTVTPQGQLRGMSLPAQTWFLSKNPTATLFLKAVLDSFESTDGRLNRAFRVLISVLRTLPDVALQRWDNFHTIFKDLNASSSKNENTISKDVMLIQVLEAFMLGRKDFEVSTNLKDKNDRIITALDGIMLKRWNQNDLQRCISIYSSFRSQDWIQLDRINGRVVCHLDNMLSHCHNSNAKIREGAARAVGEFCSQHINRSNSSGKTFEDIKMQQYRMLTYKVHAAMLELCRDRNAGSRSMSIFSMGNLASALKGLNSHEVLDASRLHEMHKAILCSFNDVNDKVVKNAIRSVGHTSNLLVLSLEREGSDEYFSASCELLVETIQSLTGKLWNTLHVALNEEQKADMTWKERSAAKKHGWGACHSLGLVFEGLSVRIFEECKELVSACSKAVHCLIHCPCHYTALNEKVVLAAMSAICHLPSNFLTLRDSQEMDLGDALKTSILIFESTQDARIDNGKVITSKLATENENFLRHLLNSASIADAAEVLRDELITTQTLCMLYSWMVERLEVDGVSAHAFDIFAVALQQPGRWTASVGLEQQFTSRALQKYKQERDCQHSSLPGAENGSSTAQNVEEEDEGDEL